MNKNNWKVTYLCSYCKKTKKFWIQTLLKINWENTIK